MITTETIKCELMAPETWPKHEDATGECVGCGRKVCTSHSMVLGVDLYCWEMAGFSELGCGKEVRDGRSL